MKLKLMPMLAGAVLLATTPFAIKAIAAPGQQLAQATTPPRADRQNPLNLTPEQQDQMRQLHQETRQKIEAILSSSQLAQYNAEMQNRWAVKNNSGQMNSATAPNNGNGRQNMFASLNLSQDQQAKIREIMQSSRTRMSSLLTDAQRTQLQQMLRARRGQAR